MNTAIKTGEPENKIFTVTRETFPALALDIFKLQYQQNPVYRQYCDSIQAEFDKIDCLEKIPFLPVSLFKTHTVTTTVFKPAIIFESSGTSQTTKSRHLIKDIGIYERSFTRTFESFYGKPKDWCILALLPSYLERNTSSLVMMAGKLIEQSKHPLSGFYLNDLKQLHKTLLENESAKQKTLLLGVTFALLDFAEQYPMPLRCTTIIETGGMKGRRTEITREQVHEILCSSFQIPEIHSEYGMTELLSQAYSTGKGIFIAPLWMKILLREEDDPFSILPWANNELLTGVLNIIDLANLYSCSFIATDDVGKLYKDGRFEVAGRLDNSEIRGCSLLTI